MIQKYVLLTICLYNIVNVACQQQQQQQHEQQITSIFSNKLPDQEMSNSQETVVVVPLSNIASTLSFESYNSFMSIPPATTSLGVIVSDGSISIAEPTTTFSRNEESIHTAQMSVDPNNESSNAAVNTLNLLMISSHNNTSISESNQIKVGLVSQIPLSASESISGISPGETSAKINVPVPTTKDIVAAAIPAKSAATPKIDIALANNIKIQPKEIKPVPPPAPVVKNTSPPPNKANVIPKVISAPNIKPAVIKPSVTTVIATVTQSIKTTATVTVAAEDAAEQRMKSCYQKNKKVSFSQYWIPKENEWDETNGGKRVYLGGNEKMRLFDKNKKEIGLAPVDMYYKCKMEGTCLLENGDLINIDNTTNNFIKVGGRGREHNVFGLGSGSQNLVPFISVAANDIPYGQKLYISSLDGVDLGGGIKHNGCVRVDDDSWSFDSCQIDFFVLSYVDYLWLELEDEVSIKYADCQLKNYITKQHLALVKASSNEKIIPSLLTDQYKI